MGDKQEKDEVFQGDYVQRDQAIRALLRADENFDMLCREFVIGGKKSCCYSIDGFLDGSIIEKVMEFLYGMKEEEMPENFAGFLRQQIPYVDVTVLQTKEDFVKAVLSGVSCFLVDGYHDMVALDLRDFPSRSVEEPDKDKVLRGSRDGFVEAIMPNAALIRRRIRDVNLVLSQQVVGRSSRTDIAVCYMHGRVKEDVLQCITDKLAQIDIDSLTMNQESLAEALFPKGWLNPFPKFKYTERPDTAAACLLEGSIVILIDNSSAAMIVPTSLFDIIEDANDYYFPPVTGTYLRLSRMLINLLAVFLTPVFILAMQYPEYVPEAFSFIQIQDEMHIPPMVQLLILEVAIDGLRMASVNTPSMLNTPLSIVAGIVFGDYTVNSGWFNSEIMLYMAFVAVANYTQSNMELGYAVKFLRIQLLILTGIWGIWGFAVGTVIAVLSPLINKTLTGRNYLYPLIPFDGVQLLQRFFRISLTRYEKIHYK